MKDVSLVEVIIFIFYNELQAIMRYTRQSGANLKTTPRMVLKVCKTINQERNNTPNVQQKNEKSLIDTIRKIIRDEFKEHETKMSEMISSNWQSANDRPDEISKDLT